MDKTYCHSIKDALLSFMGNEVLVRESNEGCVLVLPSKTVDDRFVTIFIDQKSSGYFLVHDAGKTAAELHGQGVHLTELRAETFAQMAERLGANFADGVFQVGCQEETLMSAVLAIGQCESLGMWHLLGHKPDLAEEPVETRVERGITAWNPSYPLKLEHRVRVKGTSTNHVFEFVTYPQVERREPIAIKILRPSDDPNGKAREYGFLAYDLKQTYFASWHRLAVLTKADQWSSAARNLVAEFSSATLQVETGDESSIENRIPATLELIAA